MLYARKEKLCDVTYLQLQNIVLHSHLDPYSISPRLFTAKNFALFRNACLSDFEKEEGYTPCPSHVFVPIVTRGRHMCAVTCCIIYITGPHFYARVPSSPILWGPQFYLTPAWRSNFNLNGFNSSIYWRQPNPNDIKLAVLVTCVTDAKHMQYVLEYAHSNSWPCTSSRYVTIVVFLSQICQ